MISNLYLLALLVSLCSAVFITTRHEKTIDRYYLSVMIFVPVIILGYWLKTTVHTPEAAIMAFCFIYIDSTLVLVLGFFSILRSIRVKTPPLVKLAVYGLTVFHLLTIWLSKDNGLYYSSMTLVETELGVATKMTSGPLKISHYIFLGTMFLAILTALVFGLVRKGTYSKRSLWAYSIFTLASLVIYICEMFFNFNFSMLPFLYCLGSVFLAFNYDSFQSHNMHSLIGEKMSRTGLRGFVAFDKKYRLLGYNRRFAKIFPEIEMVVIDSKIGSKYQELADFVYPLLERCVEQGNYTDTIHLKENTYSITVSAFSVDDESRINGYLLELTDVTEERKRIEFIEQYNDRLGAAIEEKTSHIKDIQNAVVLGLANLVENRDNNTGGHIKRTSDIIKYLVDEASRQGMYEIDEQKASDIVRAAPMHDLGKLYIPTEVLCKPGKLTDEEFAVMKTHATKSGEMVHIILDGVEEDHFIRTAHNVALHHHERWDGRGYPEGLMGENIPMEARIMAVADVYDALVSKRCYKEPMSFDVASRIMNENMGSQFDPAMRPVFNACRKKLEEYYSKQQ